jgi:GNAT superfamily N-acetyltransferase
MIKRNKKLRITIRRARREDLEYITRLVYYLMQIEGVGDKKKQTNLILRTRIIPTFGHNQNRTFVAEYNKKVIGLLLVEMRHNLVLSLPYLVVSRQYQGAGIGRKLIEFAKLYAKRKRVRILEVVIHKDNKDSLRFHGKLGFKLFGFVLRKQVSQ